ncbi:MAG: glycosyltransferase family 4 protein, partial [Pseudomonadota bacterium]|nr:glycosyltransferase family 4 protein [Pseudomonadota bacterium]
IAQTTSMKANLVARGIDPAKIKVIMNAVDIQKYQPIIVKNAAIQSQHDLTGKFVVGYIGTHGMSQDLIKVIDTAKLVEAKSRDIVFLFVGDGAEKASIMDYAKQQGVNNTLFISQQPKADIQNWWAVCDVALVHLKDLAIFTTVIPSKIFEAAGLGLPVVLVAPQGEASELINKEGFGIHILPQQPEIFAQQIIDLASNPAKMRTLREASIAASKIYNRENQAREFMHT